MRDRIIDPIPKHNIKTIIVLFDEHRITVETLKKSKMPRLWIIETRPFPSKGGPDAVASMIKKRWIRTEPRKEFVCAPTECISVLDGILTQQDIQLGRHIEKF
ncbi:MAG: hypothetical protein ABL983_21245, partial [Nitrospira sp.]